MIRAQATVRNEDGIHCRPSTVIAKELKDYPGEVRVTGTEGQCDPRSVMAIMTLELGPGTSVWIEVDGPNEASTCSRAVELFETRFDFPPRT
jgi:phosphocarrier protein HPr